MTHEHGLQCREVVELVTDYIEGRLDGEILARFEEHLDMCPHCGIYLQQMRTVIRALGRVHPGDLDPAAREGLMSAFRAWRADRGD